MSLDNFAPLGGYIDLDKYISTKIEKKNMKKEYYSETSEQVIDAKKAFKLTEKTEIVLNEYVVKIKNYLDNIYIEKKRDKENEIERKANELNHTMNMKKLDIS